MEKFVQELHRKYDTVFTNRKFKTAYGDTVTVYGGDYGWWMNTVKETDKLVKLIQKGAVKSVHRNIVKQRSATVTKTTVIPMQKWI